MGSFVLRFLDAMPPSSHEDSTTATLLKLVLEDLKAFYFEAATTQPDQGEADSDNLSKWFWRETVSGKVLFAVRDAHMESEDDTLRLVVTRQLVPRAHSGSSPFEVSQ